MLRLALPLAIALAAFTPASAADVAVNGTALTVTGDDGTVYAGPDLAGIVLDITDAHGTTAQIRIDGAEPDPWKADRWLYAVSALDMFGTWQPFCEPGPDGLTLAFPVAGTARPDGSFALSDSHFTFSCTAGALAKCIRFGYVPWEDAEDGTPMLGHFQACTRMVRADYCGDGTPHTRNGTLINMYDRIGVQISEPMDKLRFEAAWGPNGAIHVAHTRIPEIFDMDDLSDACGAKLLHAGETLTPEEVLALPGALLFNDSAGGR